MQHYERSMPTSLNLLALLELMQNMFFLLLLKAILLNQIPLVSMKSPMSLFASLISKQSACSLYWFLFFFPSQEQDFTSAFELIVVSSWLVSQPVKVPARSSPVLQHVIHSFQYGGVPTQCVQSLFSSVFSLVKQLLVHSNERNYNATYCVTGSCTSKWNNMKIIGHTSNWCKPVFFIQYQ